MSGWGITWRAEPGVGGSRDGRHCAVGTHNIIFPVDPGLGSMPSPAVLGSLALRSTGVEEGTAVTPTGGEVPQVGCSASADSADRTPGVRGRKGEEEKGDEKIGSFVLGEGIPPVPGRLVARIWNSEYVDMADLLRDNLEVDRRRGGDHGPHPQGSRPKPLRREVPDILSWAQCFGIYVGVIAEKYPGRVKQLLAYHTTILREARRCGGTGWRGYDAMFRQLAAADQTTDWSRLNPSLYATTFLAQQGSGGKMCHLCMGEDHAQDDCALAALQSKITKTPAPETKEDKLWGPTGGGPRELRGRRRSDQPCYSWNEGRCHFPYCRYRHVCLRCRGDHRASSCPIQLGGPSQFRHPSLPWGRGPVPPQGQL